MIHPLFGADPSPSDLLSDLLKLMQIVFYLLGGVLAILTYRAAIRGWLTPTNTEYQKRVMDRLAKLSEDLYSEFDPTSPKHWSKSNPVGNGIRKINSLFHEHQKEIRAAKKWLYGLPNLDDVRRLTNLVNPIRSDPFIPENIRDAVVDLLENRLEILNGLYTAEFEKYAGDLANGDQNPPDDHIEAIFAERKEIETITNRINDAKEKQGCGIKTIEQAVHDIRGLIQDYFDQFNPHGIGKGRRKKHEKPPDLADRGE
jgi:hypothetical protein